MNCHCVRKINVYLFWYSFQISLSNTLGSRYADRSTWIYGLETVSITRYSPTWSYGLLKNLLFRITRPVRKIWFIFWISVCGLKSVVNSLEKKIVYQIPFLKWFFQQKTIFLIYLTYAISRVVYLVTLLVQTSYPIWSLSDICDIIDSDHKDQANLLIRTNLFKWKGPVRVST